MFGSAGKRYRIKVTTGKAKGSGTNATIKIKLIDHEGKHSEQHVLDKWLHNDFEYGRIDSYTILTDKDFGRVESIVLNRDDCGMNDSWFVEHVAVEHDTEADVHFPLSRWLPPYKAMQFNKFDSQLPQMVKKNSPELYKQREAELEQKKKEFAYQPIGDIKGMPRTVKTLPPEEAFSRDYFAEVGFTGLTGKISDSLKKMRYEDEFSSFNDIYKVYGGPLSPFRIPDGHAAWRTDEKFAQLRLTGPNCTVIRGVLKDGGLPENFAVDTSLLETHFLQGQTFEQAYKNDRLFYIDYKDLDGYIAKASKERMVAPIALFYARMDGILIPLAIQLFQIASKTNPVFYPPPIDEERVWLHAKFWFGVADSNFHEPVTHLMGTHLVAGDFVTCFHNTISPSHPVYKLMLPHFIFLLNINTDGMPVLTAENGAFNNILVFGLENCYDLMLKKYQSFSLKDQGWLENDIENRGVKNLPNYHYYEDAKPMFEAIHNYIQQCIKTIYDEDKNVEEDFELQNFAQLLCNPKEGMKGVLGNGQFTTMEDLTKTLSTLVFILTNVHAAANFNQYDEYAYPPNFPFRLKGSPPTNKDSISEEDLVKLFDVNITLDTMELGRTLSLQGSNKIGNYETNYEFKPEILEHYLGFINALSKIQTDNDEKNLRRRNPYPWLSPRVVPNSISI
ncbi:polyunsaturated fatty acid 5-lipoxygenase-like [Clytia hemisphaerica]|uniref:Allene oxide synthase lipoxygenase protein n=1 Tax=Clytia hemisphaerica TaxID=252671 RepID=A0A7M5UUF9_9CNID